MMLESGPYRKWSASAFGGKKLTLLVIIAAWFSRANPYIFCGWAQKTRLGKSGICARLRATGRIFRAGSGRHMRQEIGHMLAAVIHFFSRGKEIPLCLNAPTGREDLYRKDRCLCARGSKKDPSSHIHGTKARALPWALGENL